MYRYLILCLAIMMHGSYALADYEGISCRYSSLEAVTAISSDVAVAPIGAEVGTLTLTGGVSSCTNGQYINAVALVLAPQPFEGATRYCKTTVDGISLNVERSQCTHPVAGTGPTVGFVPWPFQEPSTMTKTFTYIKTGIVAPGIHMLGPKEPYLAEYIRDIYQGTTLSGLSYVFPPGEVVGTACVLVQPNVSVDFGTVTSAGVIQPFAIEFGSCSSREDALAYNSAFSLRFHSERINVDGSALKNNLCGDCAQGLQIALTDGRGTAVDLSKTYKLSTNGSIDIGQNGLIYNFFAELQDAPGEQVLPGKIDAQLVFETIIE